MSYNKNFLDIDVLDASKRRINYIFDEFEKIYISFSGGKDSTVLLHLVCEEAIKRNKKIGLLFIDLEAQYELTIKFINASINLYKDTVEPFWITLPLSLRNAVSQYQPKWICWDSEFRNSWVRKFPDNSISDLNYFKWFYKGMEFEQFMVEFGNWYADNEKCACLVGIRCAESINRQRGIFKPKRMYNDLKWTTKVGEYGLFNAYPIYDWGVRDIWTYLGKYKKPYNEIYSRMHAAGVPLSQARICQPYGDDQRKGLWLYHILEPHNWHKIVNRVAGVNQGALYSSEYGNILGRNFISKPAHLTWKAFAVLLLESMPNTYTDHYKNKIAKFIKWFLDRDIHMEDEGPLEKGYANWKRVCKILLKNDYWCKGLSFSQTKASNYENYKFKTNEMRKQWKILE